MRGPSSGEEEATAREETQICVIVHLTLEQTSELCMAGKNLTSATEGTTEDE